MCLSINYTSFLIHLWLLQISFHNLSHMIGDTSHHKTVFLKTCVHLMWFYHSPHSQIEHHSKPKSVIHITTGCSWDLGGGLGLGKFWLKSTSDRYSDMFFLIHLDFRQVFVAGVYEHVLWVEGHWVFVSVLFYLIFLTSVVFDPAPPRLFFFFF